MRVDYRVLIFCCCAVIVALLVVGGVSDGVVRHIVQTSPLWIAIALAVRHSRWCKWAALPCFVFWLLLMIVIWLFLLGWARLVSGTFSPVEIAMTLIVGLFSSIGIIAALRIKSGVPARAAAGVVVLVAALQVMALRVSLLPQIAHR